MDRPPQDLSHPLTSLEWSEGSEILASVYNTQAVMLGSKVYIGGESINSGLSSRLLAYDFTKDSWDKLDTPTQWYALTTYHSQLVLVGGRDATTWKTTNELWALDEQHNWNKPFPPMKIKRYQACAVSVDDDYLIVAGGCGGHYAGDLDDVEVYNGNKWKQVQSLPRKCSSMKSALLEGNWYLVGQHYEVYHTSLEALIATSHSEESGQTSVWKKLPGVPLEMSTSTEFLNQLITVGRGQSGSALLAYSHSINSWVHVGDLPVACHSTCTLVLPTGELLVVGGKTRYEPLSLPFRVKVKGYLRGMDVIAETSVQVTNQAQTFHWAGYGLKLHIPQDALPAGLEECRLLIKVGLSGQFTLPQNTSLVSAVYWLDSEPRGKFSQPLTLEMQHCVKPTHTSRLSFVHAKCSQTQLPYALETVKSGVFSSESVYGSVEVTHFSLFGAVCNEPASEVRLYRACLYYLRGGVNLINMHFVITWDDETHITAVQQEYTSKSATIGPDLPIEFETDRISLKLPSNEGILDSGWRLIPLFHPMITKKQVDSFKPKRRIPSCQLMSEWTKQSKPPRLIHKVELEGAKEPFNYFHIVLDTDSISTAGLQSKYPDGLNSQPELPDLMNEVAAEIPGRWKDVGLQLGIDQGILDGISLISPGDLNHCYSNVFTRWKNQNSATYPYTWSTVVQTLKSRAVGEKRLADKIKEKLTPQ